MDTQDTLLVPDSRLDRLLYAFVGLVIPLISFLQTRVAEVIMPMRDAYKQRARMIKARFAATLVSVGIMIGGCGPAWNLVSEKRWTVGDSQIYEKIEESENNWPDYHYRRTYSLFRNGSKLDVGSCDKVIHFVTADNWQSFQIETE